MTDAAAGWQDAGLSVYLSADNSFRDHDTRTAGDVLAAVRGGSVPVGSETFDLQELTRLYRRKLARLASMSQDERDDYEPDVRWWKATHVPACSPAGRFDGKRGGAGGINYRPANAWSRLVVLDLDHVKGDAAALRDRIFEDRRCALAAVSLSGQGVFAGFTTSRDPFAAREWARIVRHVAAVMGGSGTFDLGDVDGTCRDTARLRFLPCDKDVRSRPDPQVIRLPNHADLRRLDTKREAAIVEHRQAAAKRKTAARSSEARVRAERRREDRRTRMQNQGRKYF